ncbi:MAG TPA: metal-dependent hydrolase [Ktedonobacterales bacterium]
MRGASHVVFGLAGAVLIANIPPYLAGPSLHTSTITIDHVAEKVVFYGMAALGALTPDIDNARSTLGKRLGVVSRGLQHIAGHRTFFHSLAGLAIVGALVWAAQYGVGLALAHLGLTITGDALGAGLNPNGAFLTPGVGIAFGGLMVGYFLHLVADSLTEEGVPWLWPSRVYLGFPPNRHLRFRTGSAWEPVIVVAVAVIVLAAVIFGRITI